jgi:hypothetical protein
MTRQEGEGMEKIKKRMLRMSFAGWKEAAAAEKTVRNLPGVRTVFTDRMSQTLTVFYNLRETDLKTIVETLEYMGNPVKIGAMGKLKLRFTYFTEENERTNLAAPLSPCCSQPRMIKHYGKKQ